MCANSQPWNSCDDDDRPYLSTVQDGSTVCPHETDMDNIPLTLAVLAAFDNMATYCPDPDVSQMRCNSVDDTPEFVGAFKACKDNDVLLVKAIADCGIGL
jgi:hypothetical protein